MATKKIIIEFLGQPSPGNNFRYKIYINGVILNYLNSQTSINLFFNFTPSNPNEIAIGSNVEQTVQNAVDFLTTNFGANSTAGSYLTSVTYARINNKLEITINSTAPENLITRWELISTSSNFRFITDSPCEQAFLTNQTSVNANVIFNFSPGNYQVRNINLNTTTNVVIPSRFDCAFQKGFSYALQQGGGNLLTFSFVASVNPANFVFQIINNQLSINVVGTNAILQYSLDNITYQTSSIFNDIAEGSITLYVRDSYGCIQTFLLDNSGESNTNNVGPYTYISESNSLRFVKRVDWGNCSNYKNVFNTLSFEENTRPAHKFIQKFQSCDTIKTQIKTSYQNIEVVAGTTEITAEKIVANIGIEDKRDCFYYNFQGNLAVLYNSGNLYLYGTDDVIGTYELNGQLPEYGVIGNFIETDFGIFSIVNIRIDDFGNRSLILNSNVIPDPTNENGQVQIIYNRESYDIWEFDTPMNDFLNQVFKVGIRFYQTEEDENWPDVFWISECISVKERWPYSKKIVWRNSKNTDIYFFSGIEMMARLDFCQVESNLSDGEVEIQKTDSQVLAIENTDYKAVSLEIQNLTTGILRKLKLAVKHDYLVIEDVPYVLADSPEINNLKPSNFYTFVAKLLEAGDVFNTGTANTQSVITDTELIGLLSGDDTNEYIRIL
jgi:hypothetical protein